MAERTRAEESRPFGWAADDETDKQATIGGSLDEQQHKAQQRNRRKTADHRDHARVDLHLLALHGQLIVAGCSPDRSLGKLRRYVGRRCGSPDQEFGIGTNKPAVSGR